MLPLVLYGYKMVSDINGRAQRMQKLSENRLLRIFIPKRDEMGEGWRKLYDRSFVICTDTCHQR
jgi:hypothetical protein